MGLTRCDVMVSRSSIGGHFRRGRGRLILLMSDYKNI